jgi:hypothetical protein
MTKNEKRVVRKPLHQRGPLTISGEKDSNFVYRFVNDVGSRVDQLKQAGYEMVTDENLVVGEARVSDAGQHGSAKRVVSKDGTVSYLMRQKKEWFEEDKAAKRERNDEITNQIKSKAADGMYGSIKMSRDT